MASYRRFIRLLEKWPVDATKGERDLGVFLRKQLSTNFSAGEGSRVDEAAWTRQLDSLQRLLDGKHLNRHPLPPDFLSATGLSAEECHRALSREFLDELRQQGKPGLLSRLLRRGD